MAASNPNAANGQQICAWLGLPANCWPPDHYTLLGLRPREQQIERIEQQVHERLIRVRSYQLTHPALATEAMMHLAKAFDCLMDPARKEAYDTACFPHVKAPALPAKSSAKVATVLDADTAKTLAVPPVQPAAKAAKASAEPPLQWQPSVAPPPVRATTELTDPAPPLEPEVKDSSVEPPPVRAVVAPVPTDAASADISEATPTAAAVPPALPLPPGSNLPPQKSFACFNLERLATRRDFLEHIWWTRRLVRAWNRAGKYFNRPKRQLAKAAEGAELTRLLFAIDDLLQEAPGLLGQPGQPGYRILALCSQEPVAEHFKSLDSDHRDALATDWTAGSKLLAEYRKLLMEHVKVHRRLTSWQRFRRAVDALLTVYRGYVILVIVALAALILLASLV